MASEHKPKELSLEELEAEQAANLPDREALTTIDPVAPPLLPVTDLEIMPEPAPWTPIDSSDSPLQESQ